MEKVKLLLIFILTGILLFSCHTGSQSGIVRIYPDSVLNDVSNHPVGINLDFFMDGGRFPQAGRTVTGAVGDMGMRFLRYPGGEKSDLYLFSKPPYEKAQPGMARSGGLEDYPDMITKDLDFIYDPLDFDEYIAICHATHAEPVVVVAADYYLIPLKKGQWVTPREKLIQHAAEWVRYANIKKKYGVRYWMIGNESWNSNNKNSSAGIYASDVIEFSKAMKEVDSTILIIANGSGDEFFKTVLNKAGDYIDRLTVSNYGVYNFYRGYATYRDTSQILIWPAISAINAMNTFASPAQLKKLKMIVAEYGSIDWAGLWHGSNDMGHAIVTFDMTGQLLLQPEIEFSCFWNTRWIENESKPPRDHDALDKDGNLNPTGRALSIWGNFLGGRMVKSDTTGKIISYASFDPTSHTLFAYLVHKGDQSENIVLRIDDRKIKKVQKVWEFFGTSPEDPRPVWQQVQPVKNGNSFTLKGTSITVIKMKVGI